MNPIQHIANSQKIMKGESNHTPTNNKNIQMKRMLLLFAFLLISTISLLANNLILGTPTFNNNTISFTIKWNNSWYVNKGPSNWDAVWIIVKRQHCDQNTENHWQHEVLAASGHTVTGTQLQVDLPSDKMGVFVRRSAVGMGNTTEATVTLTLNSNVGADNFSIYGTEMVNVPEGEFWLGDGNYDESQYDRRFTDGNSENPLKITKAIQDAGIGVASNYQKSNAASNASLPASFPLGYYGFYCMKYEITTGQYVAFLNSLTYNQQLRSMLDPNRMPPESPAGTAVNFVSNAYSIEIKTPGNGLTTSMPAVYGNDANNNNVYDEEDDGLGLPVALTRNQFLAYLDWAAIRPMTEFEYEKACRGPLTPVKREYAWGTTDLNGFDLNATINRFKPTETINQTGLGFANIRGWTLWRVGIAATDTSNRVRAGAAYYGMMDMTGSMTEGVLASAAYYDVSSFTTANGDGEITTDGLANTTGWAKDFIGARGGNWTDWPDGSASVSSRFYCHQDVKGGFDGNVKTFGGRGVRSN